MALLRDLLSQELPELDRELAGRLGLVFCAVPQGNTAFDLVSGVPGTLTGTGIAQGLRARNGGFSSPNADYDQVLSLTSGVAADQIIWPVSASLRGATAVQEGTLLCLGGIPESGVAREYFFGASRDTNGDGPGLRIATGAVGPGQPGTVMRSKSASTAVASSVTRFLGTTATTGLRTHFFGYSFSANGADGTWFGARRGEDWTARGTFGTGAGGGTRRAMLFTDYNNVAYNTKSAYLSLFLIFDRRLTVEQYQALYDEPQQLFKPLRVWVPVSAASGGSDFTHAASGGLQFGGDATATYTADFSQASAGGLQFGGDAAVSFTRDFAQSGAGGLTFGGAATVALDVGFTHTPTGGLQFGGTASATYTADYATTGSGGLTFGGSAAAQIDAGFAVTGSGGLTFGGSAAAEFTYAFSHLASGGLQLGGVAAAVYSANYVAAGVGGLVFGGSADASFALSSYSFSGSGGLIFGGSASVELILPTVSTSTVGYRRNPRDLTDPLLDQVRDKWDAIERVRAPVEPRTPDPKRPDDEAAQPEATAAPIPRTPPAPTAAAAALAAGLPKPSADPSPEALAAEAITKASRRRADEEALVVLLAMIV